MFCVDTLWAPFFEPWETDHEFFGVMCDPNFEEPGNQYQMAQGPYSIFRKCLYNKEVNHYLFEWAEKFLDAYKDQPKYLELTFIDGHEYTSEQIRYLDEPLEKFLTLLNQKGYVTNYSRRIS